MTEYEKGYKDGMAGAALPNIIDNGDKIDGYAYSYKTDSDGVPYINIDCVRAMLTKATDVQSVYYAENVQNEVLNYLFNKEREAEGMSYGDKRQERIATIREIIRFVEDIDPRMDGDTK